MGTLRPSPWCVPVLCRSKASDLQCSYVTRHSACTKESRMLPLQRWRDAACSAPVCSSLLLVQSNYAAAKQVQRHVSSSTALSCLASLVETEL